MSLFGNVVSELQWAVGAAAEDHCYTQSYHLTHCLMLLLVERANQLQILKQQAIACLLAPAAAAATRTRHHQSGSSAMELYLQQLGRIQQQLLQQAEAAGNSSMSLFWDQKQRLLAAAGDDLQEQQEIEAYRNVAAEEVQSLLQRLPNIAAELSSGVPDATEVAAVLVAVMQGEGGHSSLNSFLAGHLYECPNGHLFVIGNCGGAMQVSCPRGPDLGRCCQGDTQNWVHSCHQVPAVCSLSALGLQDSETQHSAMVI